MEQRSEAAKDRTGGDGRSVFDRFVEFAHHTVSRAPFFVVCAGIVALWLISVPLWTDLKTWQAAIHTVGSVFTLLVVVLLENASRRASESSHEKLNVMAEAIAVLLESSARNDPELRAAAERLRDAVGLEERH